MEILVTERPGLAARTAVSDTLRTTLLVLQLQRRGEASWRVMRFLDDAHERRVLRTVGPVYQFRHADLQDRLAEVYQQQRAANERSQAGTRSYELQDCARQPFGTLSGGQQASLQILLLEPAGSTLLLSTSRQTTWIWQVPRRCSKGLEYYQGTIVAVTHDRWLARSFDRFLVFGGDTSVYEAAEPVWKEQRVAGSR